MTVTLTPAPTSPPAPPSGLDLRALLSAIWADRLRIFGVSLIAGLVTLGVAFLFPKWYRATAVILPPDDSDLLSNLSVASRALTKFPAFGQLSDYFTPADVFKATLRSRTLQDEVVDRFDLQHVYRIKSRERTLKELKHNYDVKLAPDGTISVAVDDRDPKRAALMANSFLEFLDRFNIEQRNSRARRTREFLEQRVHETDSALRVSESALRQYQETRRTVVPTVSASAEVQSSADLMAKKIGLEVRLGVLRTYLREDNDEVRQTETELESLKSRIATLPAMQSDVTRMVRDQKILEQVFVLLTSELEEARVREMMDTPTVRILDRAIPPERHVRPKRATLAVMATLLTFAGFVVQLAVANPGRSET